MSACEHKTTIVKYDQGNVQVEVCTWGCGQTIISVKRADAITESFTAAELYSLAGNIAALAERVGRLEVLLKKSEFAGEGFCWSCGLYYGHDQGACELQAALQEAK